METQEALRVPQRLDESHDDLPVESRVAQIHRLQPLVVTNELAKGTGNELRMAQLFLFNLIFVLLDGHAALIDVVIEGRVVSEPKVVVLICRVDYRVPGEVE